MKINLLPPSPPKVRRFFLLYWVVVGILLVWLLTNLTSYLVDQSLVKTKQAAINQANLTISHMQKKINNLQKLAGQINKSSQLQILRKSLPKPVEAINELASLLPKNGAFSSISYSNGTISTSATLSSYYEAAAFIVALHKDAMFTNVSVSSVSATSNATTSGGSVTVPFSVSLAGSASSGNTLP